MTIMSADKTAIDVLGVKLQLRPVGQGSTVVHLRAGGATPETVSALATNAGVVALDLKDVVTGGKAQSDREIAQALADALAAAGNDRFSIIAQRAVCGVALWLGILKPDAVESIVLVAPAVLTEAGAPLDAELKPSLADLKAQVLALAGTKDTARAPQFGRLYRESIPRCHLVFVYDAGQDMEKERPAAVAAVMRDFLQRREQFIVSTQSGKIYP